jgi:hypothetical protein
MSEATPEETSNTPIPISSTESVAEAVTPSAKRNWFVRHWRGEETLGVAYWRNSVLIGGLVPVLLIQMYSGVDPFHYSLRAGAVAGLLIQLPRDALWIWAIVGVLRSANRHTSRGGSLFWANVARAMIGTAVIGTAIQLYNGGFTGLKELAAIATGHDPIPKLWIETVKDGSAIWLQGTIGEGSAAGVEAALDAQPRATTVILSSRGGRAVEAELIASLIKQRHLNTRVTGSCTSACTYILLAGYRRSAPDTAKIGFHQATFPGMAMLMRANSTRRMINYYQSVGLPQSFIDHVIATPPTSMWYPTHTELWDARVLNTADESSK